MGVNSLHKTVTGQRRDCDLNPGPSAPESSTLTTRLPSHPDLRKNFGNTASSSSTKSIFEAHLCSKLVIIRVAVSRCVISALEGQCFITSVTIIGYNSRYMSREM